ncbi:ROK family protein [Paenibacillus sp. J5C_2022]|uniref:ROK family protein n=1 Tax=Paenibacillus sp. J5C2022 TaxID=2977129 RepID=UPI0021D02C70|nr:ROK family protein [Paenibacillus sp. J5C2022]MCU6712746.1 ROK family protein [Paenibacillus sp. J5C2022]
MDTIIGGIDIGGTKCAVVIGKVRQGEVSIIDKVMYPTMPSPEDAVADFIRRLRLIMERHRITKLDAVGISCGGPLDSKRGLVLSPPNLPHWDRIDVISPISSAFGAPVALQNDANACALAEWKWGAGRGADNMIFLTFGTGMGAGLILGGQLYSGTNDMAGEVGHIRLAPDGPIGYGKNGSFEGFCSGGGIANLARTMARDRLAAGEAPLFCPHLGQLDGITAKSVSEAAQQGDPLALDIYRIVGTKLGNGLAMLIDLLNPEIIVIGSIYARQRALLEPLVMEQLRREALPQALASCRIVPAGLGEQVGDYASLSVAHP